MNIKMMRAAVLALGLAVVGGAFARSDVRDGNAMVTPAKGDKYSIDGSVLGKAELYGYIADLRDSAHITGVVLKRGGNDAQRKVIGSIAKTLGLKSFEQDGGDLKEIPQPVTPPPAPAIENPPAEPAAAEPAATTDKPTGG